MDESRPQKRTRPHESGQVLVLFILIFATCVLVAAVAITVGQVAVRRQQAQMVVDAAAFAGASRQAEGMNTIASLNDASLFFLRAIQISKLAPYVDNDTTTNIRLAAFLGTPILGALADDWAGDLLTEYQEGFDFINSLIDVTNCGYATVLLPQLAAREVVDENFNGGGSIFQPDDLGSQGVANPFDLVDISLVDLTDPEDYSIGGYWYLPWPTNWACNPSNCPAFPVGTALCAWCWGNYFAMDAAIIIYRSLIDPIEYQLGRFYDNDEGEDVRFAYYITISQSPVLFGKNFFNDIPEIVVAAAAKPYGGYLGDEFVDFGTSSNSASDTDDTTGSNGDSISYPAPELFNPLNWDSVSFDIFGIFYGNQPGKEISPTYRAKLVPLTVSEKAGILGQNAGTFDDFVGAGATILH